MVIQQMLGNAPNQPKPDPTWPWPWERESDDYRTTFAKSRWAVPTISAGYAVLKVLSFVFLPLAFICGTIKRAWRSSVEMCTAASMVHHQRKCDNPSCEHGSRNTQMAEMQDLIDRLNSEMDERNASAKVN